METTHKTFKPFDRVIVKDGEGKWQIDFYSYWNDDYKVHYTMSYGGGVDIRDEDILPFDEYPHLLGTTDSPDEELRLEKGELIFVDDTINDDIILWNFSRFEQVNSSDSFETKFGNIFKYAIRFSDFNPNDMEKTKKHILCVKNGKIVRYKG